MKRREFLKSTLVAGLSATVPATRLIAAEEQPLVAPREYYELRLYHLRRGSMTARFNNYCREAAIPALNRAGAGPIGVFSMNVGPDNTTMYVLVAHN